MDRRTDENASKTVYPPVSLRSLDGYKNKWQYNQYLPLPTKTGEDHNSHSILTTPRYIKFSLSPNTSKST